MRGSDSPVECVESLGIVKGKVFLFNLNSGAYFHMISFLLYSTDIAWACNFVSMHNTQVMNVVRRQHLAAPAWGMPRLAAPLLRVCGSCQ